MKAERRFPNHIKDFKEIWTSRYRTAHRFYIDIWFNRIISGYDFAGVFNATGPSHCYKHLA